MKASKVAPKKIAKIYHGCLGLRRTVGFSKFEVYNFYRFNAGHLGMPNGASLLSDLISAELFVTVS